MRINLKRISINFERRITKNILAIIAAISQIPEMTRINYVIFFGDSSLKEKRRTRDRHKNRKYKLHTFVPTRLNASANARRNSRCDKVILDIKAILPGNRSLTSHVRRQLSSLLLPQDSRVIYGRR